MSTVRYTYDVLLHVLLVQCSDAFLQKFRVLNVAHTVVKVGLKTPNARLHVTHLPHERVRYTLQVQLHFKGI